MAKDYNNNNNNPLNLQNILNMFKNGHAGMSIKANDSIGYPQLNGRSNVNFKKGIESPFYNEEVDKLITHIIKLILTVDNKAGGYDLSTHNSSGYNIDVLKNWVEKSIEQLSTFTKPLFETYYNKGYEPYTCINKEVQIGEDVTTIFFSISDHMEEWEPMLKGYCREIFEF